MRDGAWDHLPIKILIPGTSKGASESKKRRISKSSLTNMDRRKSAKKEYDTYFPTLIYRINRAAAAATALAIYRDPTAAI